MIYHARIAYMPALTLVFILCFVIIFGAIYCAPTEEFVLE